jgi:hypothetical protein
MNHRTFALRAALGAVFAIVLGLVVGCAGTANSIGGSYLAIETVADTTYEVCGNTEPGGPCRPGSLLSRADVDEIRGMLQQAQDLTNEADRLQTCVEEGGGPQCPASVQSSAVSERLQQARLAVSTAKVILRNRGVEVQ